MPWNASPTASTASPTNSENVPVESVQILAKRVPVFPSPKALEVAQDRLREKTLFRELGIATADFLPVRGAHDLDAAIKRLSLPAVLKTCRMGYDGKGQWMLRAAEDVLRAKAEMSAAANTSPDASRATNEASSAPYVLERFVPFSRELSILSRPFFDRRNYLLPARRKPSSRRHPPLVARSAPHTTLAPQEQAGEAIRRVMANLEYVGVLAIEFFQKGEALIANEMAHSRPQLRPLDHRGSAASQFENHLRAVLGWPLGSTATLGHSALLNLIGATPAPAEVLAIPHARSPSLDGKSPRPGRKLGHVHIARQLRTASRRETGSTPACLLPAPQPFRRWTPRKPPAASARASQSDKSTLAA